MLWRSRVSADMMFAGNWLEDISSSCLGIECRIIKIDTKLCCVKLSRTVEQNKTLQIDQTNLTEVKKIRHFIQHSP